MSHHPQPNCPEHLPSIISAAALTSKALLLASAWGGLCLPWTWAGFGRSPPKDSDSRPHTRHSSIAPKAWLLLQQLRKPQSHPIHLQGSSGGTWGAPEPPQSRVVRFHPRQAQHWGSALLPSTSFPWSPFQVGFFPFPNPACASPSQNREGRSENDATTITLGKRPASPQLWQGEAPSSHLPSFRPSSIRAIVSSPPGSLWEAWQETRAPGTLFFTGTSGISPGSALGKFLLSSIWISWKIQLFSTRTPGCCGYPSSIHTRCLFPPDIHPPHCAL